MLLERRGPCVLLLLHLLHQLVLGEELLDLHVRRHLVHGIGHVDRDGTRTIRSELVLHLGIVCSN